MCGRRGLAAPDSIARPRFEGPGLAKAFCNGWRFATLVEPSWKISGSEFSRLGRLPHHRPQLLLLQRPRSLLSRLLSLPLAPPRKLLVLGFAQAVVTVRKTGLSQAAACYGV
mmetsp:Transcript_36367/g.116678  ORF Transcript_36367/g.116678 Transcript_36367/m.116678 type:complete len:112 (+) Transcript_36367:582-917(+)